MGSMPVKPSILKCEHMRNHAFFFFKPLRKTALRLASTSVVCNGPVRANPRIYLLLTGSSQVGSLEMSQVMGALNWGAGIERAAIPAGLTQKTAAERTTGHRSLQLGWKLAMPGNINLCFCGRCQHPSCPRLVSARWSEISINNKKFP